MLLFFASFFGRCDIDLFGGCSFTGAM